MPRTAKIVVLAGLVLIAMSFFGALTRFAFSEALMFWPLAFLVLGLPGAATLLLPRNATLISALLAVFAALWAIWCVVASSDGSDSILLMLAAGGGVACLAIAAVAQLGAVLVRLISRDRRAWWQLLAVGFQLVSAGLVIAAALTNFPFTMRFERDRPAFDAAAQRVETGGRITTPTRIGSLIITRVNKDSGEVTFGLLDPTTSLVHSPGHAPGSADDGYTRLSGDWWMERLHD
jgi:hypothetical protein